MDEPPRPALARSLPLSFSCAGAPPGSFRVVRAGGLEELGRPYRLDLLLDTRDLSLDPASLVLLPATLALRGAGGERLFLRHGVVASVDERSCLDGLLTLQVRIVPGLWRLSLNRVNRSFRNASLPVILRTLLQEAGLPFDLAGVDPEAHPVRDLVCQSGESSLDFLQRWCQEEGLTYFFQHGADREEVVFREAPVPFPSGAGVPYDPAGRTLASFGRFASRHRAGPSGTLPTFEGRGFLPGLQPGRRFTLEEHYRAAWNRDYLVTALEHEWGEEGFQQRVEAQASEDPLRPAPLAPRPRIHGVLQAQVDPEGEGDYGERDDQGRVQVLLPRELSELPGVKAWIGTSQTGGGAESGLALHLLRGARVLLAFEKGDPDHPVITGVVPDAGFQRVARTDLRDVKGDRMLMGDPSGDAGLQLATPGAFTSAARIRTDLVMGHRLEGTLGTHTRLGVGSLADLHLGTRFLSALGPQLAFNYAPSVTADMGRHVHFGKGERTSFCYQGTNLGYTWSTACVPKHLDATVLNQRILRVGQILGVLEAAYLTSVHGLEAAGMDWMDSRLEHAASLGAAMSLSLALSVWIQQKLSELKTVPKKAFIQATMAEGGKVTLGVDEMDTNPDNVKYSKLMGPYEGKGTLADHFLQGGHLSYSGEFKSSVELDRMGIHLFNKEYHPNRHMVPPQGAPPQERYRVIQSLDLNPDRGISMVYTSWDKTLEGRIAVDGSGGITARRLSVSKKWHGLSVTGESVFLGRQIQTAVGPPATFTEVLGLTVKPINLGDPASLESLQNPANQTFSLSLANPIGPTALQGKDVTLTSPGKIALTAGERAGTLTIREDGLLQLN